MFPDFRLLLSMSLFRSLSLSLCCVGLYALLAMFQFWVGFGSGCCASAVSPSVGEDFVREHMWLGFVTAPAWVRKYTGPKGTCRVLSTEWADGMDFKAGAGAAFAAGCFWWLGASCGGGWVGLGEGGVRVRTLLRSDPTESPLEIRFAHPMFPYFCLLMSRS